MFLQKLTVRPVTGYYSIKYSQTTSRIKRHKTNVLGTVSVPNIRDLILYYQTFPLETAELPFILGGDCNNTYFGKPLYHFIIVTGRLNLRTRENVQQHAPIRYFYLFTPDIKFEFHNKRNILVAENL
jgi:hypothetical protein